jgi:hypothetical protein
MDRDRIDDTDDCRIDWRTLLPDRFARCAPFEHHKHLLVDTGADAVNGE